jgi:chemotaxis protein MotB
MNRSALVNMLPKTLPKILLVALALLWSVGCGVPEEKHNAVVQDLENTKIELANAQQQAQATEQKLKEDIALLESRIAELEKTEADLTTQLQEARGTLQMYESEHGSLEERLAATRGELEELREARAKTRERLARFREIANKFASMVEAGKLSVKIRDGKMVIELTSNVLFDSGSTEIKEAGQTALTELAGVLQQIKNREFLVAGHTDDVGQESANWELSTARAVEVVQFLQEAGVDPTKLAAAGYGEYAPVASNETAEGKALNRRIEVIMMPNLEELPTIPKDILEES